MNIYALIPARAGSKSLPNKNILPFRGEPLIAHSIRSALESKLISRTIISTDSQEYADIAIEYAAEVPFLRPSELSGDLIADGLVYKHFIDVMKLEESDLVVHLRPTNPNRAKGLIDNVLKQMVDQDAPAIRTVSPARFSPYKMVKVSDGLVSDLIPLEHKVYGTDMPRQVLTQAYELNGNVDAFRVGNILNLSEAFPRGTMAYIQPTPTSDIDTFKQFKLAEQVDI